MVSRKGRKPKRYSQVARISVMLRRLIGGATVAELADEFQVTKRQIHRDLQQIEDSGYPLRAGRGKMAASSRVQRAGGCSVTVRTHVAPSRAESSGLFEGHTVC